MSGLSRSCVVDHTVEWLVDHAVESSIAQLSAAACQEHGAASFMACTLRGKVSQEWCLEIEWLLASIGLEKSSKHCLVLGCYHSPSSHHTRICTGLTKHDEKTKPIGTYFYNPRVDGALLSTPALDAQFLSQHSGNHMADAMSGREGACQVNACLGHQSRLTVLTLLAVEGLEVPVFQLLYSIFSVLNLSSLSACPASPSLTM
eukprot:scaffold22088_cov18-Tisochrysis_lutea.AAC.1